MEERKLDTIVFAGDTFHDRHEIGVNTLHIAKQFFDILSAYQIFLIPGNHDSFLHSTVDINSVEILERPNIHVFSTLQNITLGERTFAMCPWQTDINKIGNVDAIVGHFEIINFKMNTHKICDQGQGSGTLLEIADRVITGHFHLRDHREYDDDKYILYLGSPYQMDFGDREQPRGVSVIDLDDMSVEFVENHVSPKHYRLKLTELMDKKYSDVPSLVKGNIISLYIDVKTDVLAIDLLSSKLQQYLPLTFRVEFGTLDQAQVDQQKVAEKMYIDVETAIHEFVEHVETRATKKAVLDKCLELYKACQTTSI
jgi:DNA repair exonuclease SbcCD nuclease subunit